MPSQAPPHNKKVCGIASAINITSTPQVYNDSLGKLISAATARLAAALSWSDFVHTERGRSNITPRIAQTTNHPAGPLLDYLAQHGAPVRLTTQDWSPTRLQEALERGSHQSAQGHLEFLRDEFADMVSQRFWTVLPYSVVKHLPHLRLAPLGVVPQRDRRPRTISDYTFNDTNAETVPLAPIDAMQFGRALERTLHKIYHANPRFGPVFMGKVDIADGFYRLWLEALSLPALGVVFPHLPGEEPLVAFPLALPMGWVESPPYFCAFTETAADIANWTLRSGSRSQRPHCRTDPTSWPFHGQSDTSRK